ncbi:hypothetical protein HOLleu_37264 [Holothuria leucospilota]|uniref:Uncharacterized protein n=1 Tax=Holothuria leucospilota TaxID=206669 RepID=A0A9Q1BEM5_HOLLE|nr:hypothetical protein HOLleu_37264 [Holothuria leucospilota]
MKPQTSIGGLVTYDKFEYKTQAGDTLSKTNVYKGYTEYLLLYETPKKVFGVWWHDENLKYFAVLKHVETFCRSANWQLRNISLLRKYLDDKTCEMLVHAFVTSRLDFLNSLLYGLSDLSIKKLQKIQNSAARIVKRKKRHCNATPLLKELHWLPISARIKFKILLLTFRAQRLEQPVYISQLLAPYVPPRDLRSSDKAYLSLPNPRLKAYGYRCFAYSAPYLWNQLPDHIRFCTELSVFKSYLKTHIFTCSFDCN